MTGLPAQVRPFKLLRIVRIASALDGCVQEHCCVFWICSRGFRDSESGAMDPYTPTLYTTTGALPTKEQ